MDEALYGHNDPSPWRAQVVAVVTNSSRNSTALDCVEKIFEHLRRGTNDDPRLAYRTICLVDEHDQVRLNSGCAEYGHSAPLLGLPLVWPAPTLVLILTRCT